MLRVRTAFNGGSGTPYLSTMYWAGTNNSDADAAASATAGFWFNLRDFLSTTVSYQVQSEVANIDEATGTLLNIYNTTAISAAGTDSPAPLPWATQGLIRWGTGAIVSGHRLQGRTFIPAATEQRNDNGFPNAGYIAGLQNAIDSLLGVFDAQLVVWSKAHGTARSVTGGTVSNNWALLSSRRDG